MSDRLHLSDLSESSDRSDFAALALAPGEHVRAVGAGIDVARVPAGTVAVHQLSSDGRVVSEHRVCRHRRGQRQ